MKQVVKDVDGKISSKRIVILISMAAFLGFSLIDTFTSYTVNSTIYTALEWLIIGGLGVVGTERFKKQTPK